MDSILKASEFIKTNLQYLMVAAIVLGLCNVYLFGGFVIPKWILLFIMIFFVVYPVLIDTKFSEIISHLREPRPIFCSFVLNFLFSPFIAYIISMVFLSDEPELFTALMLISLIPTSAMSTAWTSFSGGSLPTVLYLVPFNLLFASFVALPFMLPLFVSEAITINQLTILKNIFLVFGVPLILGQATRVMIIRFKGIDTYSSIQPEFKGISAAGILVLLFLVMSLKRNTLLLGQYSLIVKILVPVLAYYACIYTISIVWARYLVWRKTLSAEKAITLVYTSVTRHVNISLALVLSAFALNQASLMVLLVVLAYVIQVPSMAFYAQHYGKRFVSMNQAGQQPEDDRP
ncbi:MAG: arsenic resistance protein [Deltaproteobacteria bacterium]|nr:arsenic resistance protein [Deltaproteobacteria bacterium]